MREHVVVHLSILTGTTGGAGANCASGKKMITYICEDTSNKAYFTGASTYLQMLAFYVDGGM